jgi:hypothetical protein
LQIVSAVDAAGRLSPLPPDPIEIVVPLVALTATLYLYPPDQNTATLSLVVIECDATVTTPTESLVRVVRVPDTAAGRLTSLDACVSSSRLTTESIDFNPNLQPMYAIN